jgi:hypothetical protein
MIHLAALIVSTIIVVATLVALAPLILHLVGAILGCLLAWFVGSLALAAAFGQLPQTWELAVVQYLVGGTLLGLAYIAMVVLAPAAKK